MNNNIKTRKIKIEIEVPERLNIWQDSEISTEEEAYKQLGKKNVIKFQEETAKELYKYIQNHLKNYIEDDVDFICGIHENVVGIEDWDSLEDYGIKVYVK